MNNIPVLCLGAVCLLMAIMYTIFGQKGGWQGLLVRGLAIVSCLALALVSANLKSITHALPLFVTIGFALLLLSEALKVAGIEDEKANIVTFGVLNSVGFVSIALGGMALGEFNYFAIVGGVFLGIALGCIVCAVKKYKKPARVFVEIFTYMSMGFIVGFGLMSVLGSSHFYSSVCMLGGGVLLIVQKLMTSLGKGKAVTYIANALYIIALTALSVTIYLY